MKGRIYLYNLQANWAVIYFEAFFLSKGLLTLLFSSLLELLYKILFIHLALVYDFYKETRNSLFLHDGPIGLTVVLGLDAVGSGLICFVDPDPCLVEAALVVCASKQAGKEF